MSNEDYALFLIVVLIFASFFTIVDAWAWIGALVLLAGAIGSLAFGIKLTKRKRKRKVKMRHAQISLKASGKKG
jgi:uncharacterized membrane protein YfcA